MRRWLGVLGLLLIGASGLGLGYLIAGGGKAAKHTVVRGDTLGEIASTYDVTVDQLRAWNHISGDLIEVGDVIVVYGDAPIQQAVGQVHKTRTRPKSSSPRQKDTTAPTALRMPAAKPCLSGPTGDGLADEGAVASAGLSYEQLKHAMDAFVPHTLRCLPRGGSGRVHTRIRVACNGRVDLVEIESSSGLSADVTACVQDTLRYAAFPAHDLPDGELFEYPLTFNWE